ncbi:MAG: ABC transporter ATP-binding protein [Candidatus Omnitrophica bacterium]|nr:ABC transporter ATP-binding protein [Candidatus Omnitrophota bacterium]
MLLEVENLHSGYGKVEILKGITLQVPPGKIITLIGCNGAGKTTFLMTLSGLVAARKGTIRFEGKAIERLSPDAVVRSGITHVPEGRRVFQHLTVSENLDLGAYTRRGSPEVKRDREEMLELFPVLKKRLKGLAGNLSGGEQQMLAMARALMSRPKLLLLDEPSLGLAPKMVEVIFSLIQKIHRQGMTVLLVEQNAFKALENADYGYVIESGRIKMEGPGNMLLENPEIKQAYLGE